jgi:hypothetical protein
LASGRGGPRYCGGQQSGLKNGRASPNARCAMRAGGPLGFGFCPGAAPCPCGPMPHAPSGGALKIQPAAPGIPFGRFGVHLDRRPKWVCGKFGGICFAPPQVPPAPRPRPPGALTPRLSLAPCCAGQPPFGHIQASKRRPGGPYLLPLDSMRRRRWSSQAKITDRAAFERKSKALKTPSGLDALHSHEEGRRVPRRDEILHLADYHRHTATPLGPLVNPS